MDPKKILILTALDLEARALRAVMIDDRGIGRASRLPLLDSPKDIAIVMLCGLAGALNPELAMGDVVIDDRDNVVPADVPIRRGVIHTATEIVSTPFAKAELFRRTHADAVDMEQAIVREWCDRRGIPLIGVRAISDTASETLNPAIAGFVDDLGRPRPIQLAMALLRQPALIPELKQLNRASKFALMQLSAAIKLLK
jgi:hypothetical protein